MKRKLNQIFEDVEILEYPKQKNVDKLAIDNEYPADVEPNEESWAGGDNLHNPVDHSSAGGSEPVTRGQETLKIKESYLRKVISRMVLETLGLTEEVLGEPDLSSEKEREDPETVNDELNTVVGGGIAGHMASGIDYDPENPRRRKKEEK
tara:strand:- start:671 stop:1120 length:450 start_codon:yes stop_codon:yes gene_type:complete